MSGTMVQNLRFALLGEDVTASKSMEGVDSTAQKVTKNVGGAFTKLGGIVGGEFGEVLNKVGEGIEAVGEQGKHLGAGLTIGGGAAVAAGLALQQLGSKEKQATDQLQAAIKQTGASWEEYEKQIDQVIAKQQNFDHSAVDSKEALRTLVGATGSTSTAIKNMAVVSDLAAARHISLAAAAKDVAKILNGGGTKSLAAYGITMEKSYDNTNDLAKGQIELQRATQKVTDAVAKLKEIEAIDASKKKLTIAQQYQLAAAHKKVSDAEAIVATATQHLTDLQGKNVTKTMAGKEAITQLAAKLKGQGAASVDNFGSQVDIVRTKITDWVEEMAGPVGNTLTTVGTVLSIAGTGLELYVAIQDKRAAKELAAAAATTVSTVATEAAAVADGELAVAQTAVNAAMDVNPILLVGAAVGTLAAVIGGALIIGATKATHATQDLTQAMQEDSDAVGENTRKKIVNGLINDGTADKARKLGISVKDLTDASLGNTAAQASVNAALERHRKALADATGSTVKNLGVNRTLTDTQYKLLDSINAVSDAVEGNNKDIKKSLHTIDLQKDGMNDAATAAGTAAKNVKQYGIELSKLKDIGTTTIETNFIKHKGKGGHATGGDFSAGDSFMVGENGPERVIAGGRGTVIPSQRSGMGGGMNINVVIHAGVGADGNAIAKQFVTWLTNARKAGQIPANALASVSG